MRIGILATHPIQNQAPLFRALAKLGQLNFKVIFSCNWGVQSSYDEEFGQEFCWDIDLLNGYPYQFAKPIRWLNRKMRNPRHFWSNIWAQLQQFDFIVIRGYASVPELQALVYCMLFNVPFAMMPDGPQSSREGSNLFRRVMRKYFLKAIFKRANLFFSVGTRSTVNFLAHGGDPSRLHLTLYCVDTEFFAPTTRFQEESYRISTKGSEKTVRFLFAGKLSARKGIIELIRTFKDSFQTTENVSLTIAGDGVLRKEIETLASDRPQQFKLLGFQNQTQMRHIYNTHHCLVLPSIWGETWGLVVNEALSSGIPVIVSNAVGCAEDLISPDTGLVFDIANPESLKMGLLTAYSNLLSEKWPNREALAAMSEAASPQEAALAISRSLSSNLGTPQKNRKAP